MDSDEDLLDPYDGDSGEDFDFSPHHDSDADYAYSSDDDIIRRSQKSYRVLKESDVKQRQDENISHVSSVLLITRSEATLLLCRYKWNVSQLHDEWFADEEGVRSAIGLLSRPVVQFQNPKKLTCGICFDSFPVEQIHSTVCGHPYCTTCWKGYVTTSIKDGPGCLLLRCPDPSCKAAVGPDMIHDLASNEDKEKYFRYVYRSYVESKKKTKWCPAPDCENAVEYEVGSNIYDVTCLCSHDFCWNCTEDAHRPVDCSTVATWIMKNSAESENVNWILANSKPCPKCKRPIEKNQGCMHITCTPPCKFEFCWLCLGAWSDHGERTGGFYACNRYEAAKQEGVYDEDEKIRELAKNSLEKYTHYFERWASNEKSRQRAIKDLHQMQTVKLETLSEKLKEPESQLKFILEAWQQIIECRRVLKWTYAYGYYLPENEIAKKHLFEYLQGEAEAGLERLHKCAEKDLEEFCELQQDETLVHTCAEKGLKEFSETEKCEKFKEFRPRLSGLTRVTRSYFENLVRTLENGLADVNTQSASSTMTTSKKAKSKGGKGKTSTSRPSQSGATDIEAVNYWNCDQCTFANPEPSTLCQMCFIDRWSS